MTPQGKAWKTVRSQNIPGCMAGLLRFATPGEVDALLGHLPDVFVWVAMNSHGMPNRVITEALLRRGRADDLNKLVEHALLTEQSPLLGRLLDLDDPEVNAALLYVEVDNALLPLPRNLHRQLARQTSRRDDGTPRPLPERVRAELSDMRGEPCAYDHALLYAADPDLAGSALRFLGAGADPHGAVWACRTLLDAGRFDEVRQLVEAGRLPAAGWPQDRSEPSVLAYAQAALLSGEGMERLRELSRRVRRPEFLRSVGEIADADGCEPWRNRRPLVRSVVHRRRPGIPRVDWDAVTADKAPIPYRAARFIANRTDAPLDLTRRIIAEHPELAVLVCDPAPEVLADLRGQGARPGADVFVKVAGNGFVAGTFDAGFVVETVPQEALRDVADALWLPGLRGTAQVRRLLGRDGDIELSPLFVDETGHGRTRRLRDPNVRQQWDPEWAYWKGPAWADGNEVAELFHERPTVTADDVLAAATVDALLAPNGGWPDPRVLRRLAEHVDRNLGGRPEAWLVALKLMEDGFVGTFPELLATAGAVTS